MIVFLYILTYIPIYSHVFLTTRLQISAILGAWLFLPQSHFCNCWQEEIEKYPQLTWISHFYKLQTICIHSLLHLLSKQIPLVFARMFALWLVIYFHFSYIFICCSHLHSYLYLSVSIATLVLNLPFLALSPVCLCCLPTIRICLSFVFAFVIW